ncbi:carboxypeptidase-like regulatory domain-containing protein [Streptomyces sp. NPDC052301]|uniref:carboxypeptidase-like regulatory domain-containing protein n=1 Tax=Streptomyces sp. NPDC052301 TaxID=3365687 RepID=UPI0037D3C129
MLVGPHPVSDDLLLGGTSGLAGVVRSADGGAPVPGAVVIVTGVRGEVPATVRTDGLGAFRLTGLVPGTATLAAGAPRYRPLALPVEIDGTEVTPRRGRAESRRPGCAARCGARSDRSATPG